MGINSLISKGVNKGAPESKSGESKSPRLEGWIVLQ